MEVIGWIASVLTILSVLYGCGKFLIAKLANRMDGASRATVTVVNWITTGFLERTVVVPYMVEKVFVEVVPVFIPQSAGVPEWLRPERPVPTWTTRPPRPLSTRSEPRPTTRAGTAPSDRNPWGRSTLGHSFGDSGPGHGHASQFEVRGGMGDGQSGRSAR